MTRTASPFPLGLGSFGEGVVVTRGFDGCLYAYTRARWEQVVEERFASVDPLSADGRAAHAAFLRKRPGGRARQAGPGVMLPAALIERARLGREVVVAGVYDHLEIWDRAAWRAQEASSRECGACCRTSCCQARLITSPSSPRRCATPRGSTRCHRVDATFGARRPRRAASCGCRGHGRFVAIDRDPTVRPYFERFARRHGGLQTRFLRGQASIVLAQLASNGVRGRRGPARPSRLRACRSTAPSAASRTRSTLRSTCAWIRRRTSRRASS